jgi:addiction module HigA family antidote
LQELLSEYGLSQYALAQAIGVPPIRISQILRGKRAVTVDTAFRLGRFFGQSPQYWLNWQSHYELEKAIDTGLPQRIAAEVVPFAVSSAALQ